MQKSREGLRGRQAFQGQQWGAISCLEALLTLGKKGAFYRSPRKIAVAGKLGPEYPAQKQTVQSKGPPPRNIRPGNKKSGPKVRFFQRLAKLAVSWSLAENPRDRNIRPRPKRSGPIFRFFQRLAHKFLSRKSTTPEYPALTQIVRPNIPVLQTDRNNRTSITNARKLQMGDRKSVV